MPGQGNSGPSAYPRDRNDRTSNAVCDIPGSSQPRYSNDLSGQTHDSAHDTWPDEIDSYVAPGAPGSSSISVPPGVSMVAEEGMDPNESVSAFTAVSHYPNVVNTDSNPIAVSQVVNAVFEREHFFRHGNVHSSGTAELHRSSSPPADLYISDSEMTDALADIGGVSLGTYATSGGPDLDNIYQQIVSNHATGNNISTIPEDSEIGDGGNLITDYEPSISAERSTPVSVRDDDPDDTRKFYQDNEADRRHEEDYIELDYRDHHEGMGRLSDVDIDDFYQQNSDYDSFSQSTDIPFPPGHDVHGNYFSDSEDPAADFEAEAHFPSSVVHGTTYERNLTIDQFINQWLVQSSAAPVPNLLPVRTPFPPHPIASILGWTPPEKVVRPSRVPGDFFDVQQIPWWETLRVKRSDARALRDHWYTSYHNLEYLHQRTAKLPLEEFYFREKSMHTKHKATIKHFQLRNLMSVVSYNTVHFAHESKLLSWAPGYDDLNCLVDLTRPAVETGFQGPVKFTTMKSAHDVSIAGGFCGEYALRPFGTEGEGVQGLVTNNPNGITNHLDIIQHRTNRTPMGIFASNDRHLRVLDCETNTFVTDHELSRAINCTSTSSDGRLRVVIGDSADAWVIEADTGRPVHPLRGHRDFGFACAWSPDMRHIATSNQDKKVIIWDARMWRMLEKIESDVAGYRSLRFSPVGGGPRTLLCCEPADRISIINAQTFQSRQVHDFFGEIGGADYSPDGSAIWVANTDQHFGGFMEFERRQWGQRFKQRGLPNEWARESELDDDERCVLNERERQMRFWWNMSDEEHEELML
ncbi:hypothetical protein MW887_006448 [Aspergillus wentii]|nr:hypothetical protein MW887_006448 [Aspergillus wentii]